MRIKIESNEYCTDSYHSGEEWGDWWSEHEFTLDGARVATDKAVCDVYDLNVKVGDKVYVVVIRYGSGDSFGRSSGNGEIVHVFSDRVFAEACVEAVKTCDDNNCTCKFMVEVGDDLKEIEWYNPSIGYFESFENLDIFELVVEETL